MSKQGLGRLLGAVMLVTLGVVSGIAFTVSCGSVGGATAADACSCPDVASNVGVAKAWVYYRPDTGTINGYNISTVVKSSTGVYTVVFQTPMPDGKYAAIASSTVGPVIIQSNTATSVAVNAYGLGGSASDGEIFLAVYDR